MCIEAQIHESLLKRLRPEIGSGLPLFTNCREEFFSETRLLVGASAYHYAGPVP